MTDASLVKIRMICDGKKNATSVIRTPTSTANRTPIDAIFRMLPVSRFPPVQGGQNQDRALDARDEHLQHRLQLVSDVYAGNRAVAERADHQVIGKIHGEGHRVLQRDRDGEPHKRLVKIPVSRKEHIFHFLLNTTAPNCVFGLIIMNPMANVNIRRRLKKVCGARAARIPAKRKITRKKKASGGCSPLEAFCMFITRNRAS